MLIDANDNLFDAVAKSLVQSDLSELFLVAGHEFETVPASAAESVSQALTKAEDQFSHARTALAAHFNSCGSMLNRNVVFCDGATAVIDVNGVLVAFSIKQIRSEPTTFRVLFSRVDAGKLYFSVQEQLAALAGKVENLASAARTRN